MSWSWNSSPVPWRQLDPIDKMTHVVAFLLLVTLLVAIGFTWLYSE